MKLIVNIAFSILILNALMLKAQPMSDDLVIKAMSDELKRSMNYLQLENHKPPFFIAYQLYDNKVTSIKASLGSIMQSQTNESRSNYMRLMMGDYAFNDENFVGGRSSNYSSGYSPVPIENDYNAIRQAYWSMTDQVYKSAIETYEQKKTALKLQNKDEARLDDYSRIVPLSYVKKTMPENIDTKYWENVAKQVSAVFVPYNKISNSTVYVYSLNCKFYMVSSEGSTVEVPVTLAMVMISAGIKAEDGEQLYDLVRIVAPQLDKLPKTEQMMAEAKKLANNLAEMANAPSIDDNYKGPVVFEDEALADVVSQSLFANEKLLAQREPDFAEERQSEEANADLKIDKKICDENISVISRPALKSFLNTDLVGSFEIDAEGVNPKDELVLVENGKLKNLLNDRIPTRLQKESNGYSRISLYNEGISSPQKAPANVELRYKKSKSYEKVLKAASKDSKQHDLKYYYIVRKVAGNKPLLIYQVSNKTGEEKLVRKALLSDFGFEKFEDIIAASEEQTVQNTLLSQSRTFVPVSYILPKAMTFSDITITKDRSPKQKLPVVKNPLEE